MYTRKQALAYARQQRTCPPLRIRNNPAFKQDTARHISQCPFCAAGILSDTDDWALLAEKIKNDFGQIIKEKKSPKDISSGQVRSSREDSGLWLNGCYYTPPDVLVLDVGMTSADAVMVAQIYNDVTLAGPGDLIIAPRKNLPDEVFVETWNIYTLTRSRLGPLIGTVPKKVVAAVKRMDQDPDYLPDWADCLTTFAEEDPRIYFRDLEIEVGYVFSAPAVHELMTELETGGQAINLADIKALKKDLASKDAGVRWKKDPTTLSEIVLTASYTDDGTRMAASSDPNAGLDVRLYRIKGTKFTLLKSARAEIYLQETVGDAVEVSGRVYDLPDDFRQADFLCCLVDKKDDTPVSPDESEWDRDGGHFFVRFASPPGLSFDDFYLRLALLDRET